MSLKDPFIREPKLDPAAVGISFVDILFALVVGQILAPVAAWMTHPQRAANSISAQAWLALTVALVLTITSWIGYHNSSNAAHFRLQFVNVELIKFALDIAMVVAYFLVAANAARREPSLDIETGLIAASFGLYLLWDFAGVYQRRRTPLRGHRNPYREEWEAVRKDADRKDVPELQIFRRTNRGRVLTTFLGMVATVALFVVVRVWYPNDATECTAIVVGSLLLGVLAAYRIIKEVWPEAAEWKPLDDERHKKATSTPG
jgi:hypothetical protein